MKNSHYQCDVCKVEAITELDRIPDGWELHRTLKSDGSLQDEQYHCGECSKAISEALSKRSGVRIGVSSSLLVKET